jgi:hypothetical protein
MAEFDIQVATAVDMSPNQIATTLVTKKLQLAVTAAKEAGLVVNPVNVESIYHLIEKEAASLAKNR